MFKHLHMTLALISVILFTLRFVWLMVNPEKLNQKWVKVAPHVIDTFLLIFGIIMMVKLAINPMEQLWLLEKIIGVFAYIFTGYFTLKIARNNAMKILGYLGAIGWIMLIVRIAVSKQTVFF